MFDTVLWATDGSENATRALPWARGLLSGEEALLIAVHIVLEPAGAPPPKAAASSLDLLGDVRQLVADISDQGLNIALKVANYAGSQPAQAIADIAREVDADVIVVGTRGHSRLGGLIVGSVAQQLLAVAPCPVLSVPPAAVLGESPAPRLVAT